MKNVRIFLAFFVLLAIASAFVIPKHHLKSVQKHQKFFTTVTEETTFSAGDGQGDFVIATGTSTTALRLKNSSNYPNGLQALGTNTSCSGSGKVCKATISYTLGDLDTDPNPSLQNVIDAIFNHYVPDTSPATNSGHFSTPITFTVGSNPVVITVTIVEKS